MLSKEEIKYRLYTPEDRNFVFSSYLRSYRNEIKKGTDAYYKYQEPFFDMLLRQGVCLIACHPTNENDIFGWVLLSNQEKPIINYVYTKQIYRNFGIATGLLANFGIHWKEDIVQTDHSTPASRMLAKKYNTIEVVDAQV